MHITISVLGRFHAFYLARGLLQQGASCRLITSYPAFEVVKYGIPRKNVKSVILPEIIHRLWEAMPSFINNIYSPEFMILKLFDKLVAKEIAKTDIFSGWSGSSLLSLRKAKELGAKTVLTRSSSHILYQQQILKEEFERWGLRFKAAHPRIVDEELAEYKETQYIEVPSSFAKDSFLKYGVSEQKIIRSFHGVDPVEFRQIPKEDRVFRVIFAGHISLRKGVQYLLKAFSEARLPGSELLLVGSVGSEMRPILKKYTGGFKWIDHLPQIQLHRHYSQGSVFVMPSLEEGMAYVQLQAMACGLPLICTTNTGGADIIRDGLEGFVVPIRDAQALKERIVYLYEHPEERSLMGQRAQERVINNFTWGHYTKQMFSYYGKILKQEDLF